MVKNFTGTKFTLHDYRVVDPRHPDSPKHELATILYKANMTGRDPNAFTAIIPRNDEEYLEQPQEETLLQPYETTKKTKTEDKSFIEKMKMSKKHSYVERREALKATHRARRAQRSAAATSATTTTRTEERLAVSSQTTTSTSKPPKAVLKTPVLQGGTTFRKPRRVFIKLKLKSKGANGFYHYLLGEFLPVLDIILQGDHAADPVFLVWPKKQTLKYVKKISQFRHFYEELPFTINAVAGLPSELDEGDVVYDLVRLDKPSLKFKDPRPVGSLQTSVRWLRDYAIATSLKEMGRTHVSSKKMIVVFQRRDDVGRLNRSVDNIEEVIVAFKEQHPGVQVVLSEPSGAKPLLEQIYEYASLGEGHPKVVLVAEHGAGLIHSFWVPPAETVVLEIGTTTKLRRHYFSRMGECLGYKVVPIEVNGDGVVPSTAAKGHTVSVEHVIAEIEKEL